MQISYIMRRWKRALSRHFPDRDIILRTDGKVWFLKASKNFQISGLFLVLILVGWGMYSSFTFFINDKIIEAKEIEILRGHLVYRSLLSDVSDYQSKFTALTNDLEKHQGLMLDLVEKNAALQQNLSSAESQLVSSKEQFVSQLMSSKRREDVFAATKDNLKVKLSEIKQGMRKLNTRNFELKGDLLTISGSLENALTERNTALAKNTRLVKNSEELKQKLAALRNSEKSVVARLTRTTTNEIDNLEKLINRTGLSNKKLFTGKESHQSSGQGGPFIELRANSSSSDFLKASITNLEGRLEHLSKLKHILSIMPLSPPLDYFSISSHYGKRRDPINRRWAMHYGLDLGGVRMSRVYVTAPGKVAKAGHKGKFGRFVEIDHGEGFKTRYGHLQKILVKRGQIVKYRQKIGLLGSTGRSTGPHLHYEVLHNGKSLNPWKFIKAGRYVYKN